MVTHRMSSDLCHTKSKHIDMVIPVPIELEPSHGMATTSSGTCFFKLQLLLSKTPQALCSEVE